MTAMKHLAAASLITGGLLLGTAVAQVPAQPVPELQIEDLVDEGMVDARILEMDADERVLTVRMEETQDEAILIVPDDADIIRTFPNELEEDIELDELHVGDMIRLQGVEVDGVIRITIIGPVA